MKASGIAPDRAAYNALIDACASAGDVARAEGAFGELCGAGIAPDVVSYTGIIKACAVAGETERADRFFLEMQQKSNTTFTPPTAHTRHLMAAHFKAGSTERVVGLWGEMKVRELEPRFAHYALVLQAIAAHPETPFALPRALEVYGEMRSDGYRLDTRTLLALDHMCRQLGRHDLASQLRRERSVAPETAAAP